VRLLPADQEALLHGLSDGTIAVALTYDLGLDGDVVFRPLRPAPPYAIVAGGHPLARRKGVSLRELAPLPLVLLDLPLSRTYFLDLFREAGVQPNVERAASDPELVRSLVAQGYGYSLANARPAPTQAIDGAPLATVPVRRPAHAPQIGLATRAGLSQTRSADAFAEVCQELIR
jgi:DNA-binding transcriptional LysR family regulator